MTRDDKKRLRDFAMVGAIAPCLVWLAFQMGAWHVALLASVGFGLLGLTIGWLTRDRGYEQPKNTR